MLGKFVGLSIFGDILIRKAKYIFSPVLRIFFSIFVWIPKHIFGPIVSIFIKIASSVLGFIFSAFAIIIPKVASLFEYAVRFFLSIFGVILANLGLFLAKIKK